MPPAAAHRHDDDEPTASEDFTPEDEDDSLPPAPPIPAGLSPEVHTLVATNQWAIQHQGKLMRIEFRRMRNLMRHQAAAQRAPAPVPDGQRWWQKMTERAAPKLWEAFRTPLGLVGLGLAVLVLARALGVTPQAVMHWLGSAPVPVEIAGQPIAVEAR